MVQITLSLTTLLLAVNFVSVFAAPLGSKGGDLLERRDFAVDDDFVLPERRELFDEELYARDFDDIEKREENKNILFARANDFELSRRDTSGLEKRSGLFSGLASLFGFHKPSDVKCAEDPDSVNCKKHRKQKLKAKGIRKLLKKLKHRLHKLKKSAKNVAKKIKELTAKLKKLEAKEGKGKKDSKPKSESGSKPKSDPGSKPKSEPGSKSKPDHKSPDSKATPPSTESSPPAAPVPSPPVDSKSTTSHAEVPPSLSSPASSSSLKTDSTPHTASLESKLSSPQVEPTPPGPVGVNTAEHTPASNLPSTPNMRRRRLAERGVTLVGVPVGNRFVGMADAIDQ